MMPPSDILEDYLNLLLTHQQFVSLVNEIEY
jgi:hypothetical protein